MNFMIRITQKVLAVFSNISKITAATWTLKDQKSLPGNSKTACLICRIAHDGACLKVSSSSFLIECRWFQWLGFSHWLCLGESSYVNLSERSSLVELSLLNSRLVTFFLTSLWGVMAWPARIRDRRFVCGKTSISTQHPLTIVGWFYQVNTRDSDCVSSSVWYCSSGSYWHLSYSETAPESSVSQLCSEKLSC